MKKIFFSRSAGRDLKRLPEVTRDDLRAKYIPLLSKNPRAGKMLHGPLRGLFSYEFWSDGVSYRIAYELTQNDVLILMIDTRNNFYKKFSRRMS